MINFMLDVGSKQMINSMLARMINYILDVGSKQMVNSVLAFGSK